MALVVDDDFHLQGIVTDGDIRRGLLKQQSLTTKTKTIMNAAPLTASIGTSQQELLNICQQKDIQHIPIIDPSYRLCGLETLKHLLKPEPKSNWVVLMAGGFGTRLHPLTENCPKPLLKIEQKPMLEIIMDGFKSAGFNRFIICVNYLGAMIESYFGDGSQFDSDIVYVKESEPLGTAGALSLLPFQPRQTFFVMNADIMTQVNYAHVLAEHEKQHACATMCVRKQEYQVPYGVVTAEGGQLKAIDEKPVFDYYVNAGIYLLEPNVLTSVKNNEACHMTDLLSNLTQDGKQVATFSVNEYWQDIGRPEDFYRAQLDYQELFL